MSTTRPIFHHACWFALLGPYVGVLWAIVAITLQSRNPSFSFLWDIVTMLPVFLIITWLIGVVPALLAGIAIACLPAEIYAFHYRRILASAIIGVAISAAAVILAMLLLSNPNLKNFILIFHDNDFRTIAGSGLFAGLVMGGLIPYLPGMKSEENAG
ncbi:MAG: hypothetical protein P0Y63_26565 [Klebsiella huaxiensis]|uniref:hypothetical protein n=1 Tax=Klebsiella huaxiensis TaxID=2153354 RepID=UPI0026EDD939|nr:hypothetical protein [Klebsiella huaxiensis]WEJ88780.1 MAG: hypothetical protein P0Y63_26565 [Klebsiella huaxiensis]